MAVSVAVVLSESKPAGEQCRAASPEAVVLCNPFRVKRMRGGGAIHGCTYGAPAGNTL